MNYPPCVKKFKGLEMYLLGGGETALLVMVGVHPQRRKVDWVG